MFYSSTFAKKPNKYYKHDIDCGDETEIRKLIVAETLRGNGSNLEQPIQELIRLMFSDRIMVETMLEFQLDTQILPCGKMSKRQIHGAMQVLNDISKLIAESSSLHVNFVEASNKFYTMIPHNFGVKLPTVINTRVLVKEKMEMLESLLQYKLVYGLAKMGIDEKEKTLDDIYAQLKTDVRTIDKTGPEYEMIQKYVKNTQSSFHNREWDLELEEVFQVKREGEEKRFEPFKNLHNRQLLWHGSRVTNFTGILINGLKIAPPEAPTTGLMYGKGIYFADMVSKSAQYCYTTPTSNIGLMLLCQVALGNTLDLNKPKDIKELPPNKHSTKGIGNTYPNPESFFTRPDGVTVPLGELITDIDEQVKLNYNEYVVYDAVQVKCEYVLRIRFHYKDLANATE